MTTATENTLAPRSTKSTVGPIYPTNWPFPVGYYRWTCPECGDICEDPADVWETMCHNGHVVKLALTTDFAHDHIVAEYDNQAQAQVSQNPVVNYVENSMANKLDLALDQIHERLINMPEYGEGMNACLGGMARNFNPHAQNSYEHASWDLGWSDTNDEMKK